MGTARALGEVERVLARIVDVGIIHDSCGDGVCLLARHGRPAVGILDVGESAHDVGRFDGAVVVAVEEVKLCVCIRPLR